MSEKYKDIIDLPHHVSTKHRHMSRINRAAQFAPFAALSGYGDAVEETARLTDARAELAGTQQEWLNLCLNILRENIAMQPEISVTYFQPDSRKTGGAYLSITGNLRRIDDVERLLLFTDGRALSLNDVVRIQGTILPGDCP